MSNSIYDLLPVFNQLEPNSLKGLQAGLVVSQLNVKEGSKLIKEVNGHRYVENGCLAKLTKAGIDVADGGATEVPGSGDGAATPIAVEDQEKCLFLVYSEPLRRFSKAVKNYATDIDSEDVRLVQLRPGDEWTTTIAPTDEAYKAEIAKGHILQVGVDATKGLTKDDFWTGYRADGTKAYHYVFLGR